MNSGSKMTNSATSHSVSIFIISILLIAVSSTGCNSSGNIRGSVSAARYINLNIKQQSAPLVVRVYQLRDKQRFVSSDYQALITNDRQVLANDLIRAESFVIRPTQTVPYNTRLDKDVRYIGFMGHFRNTQGVRWKAIHRVSLFRNEHLAVEIDMNGFDINRKERTKMSRQGDRLASSRHDSGQSHHHHHHHHHYGHNENKEHDKYKEKKGFWGKSKRGFRDQRFSYYERFRKKGERPERPEKPEAPEKPEISRDDFFGSKSDLIDSIFKRK